MTSFYNKLTLNHKPLGENPSTENINILKKDFTLSYTDYEKLKKGEQYNKLYSNIYQTNRNDIQQNENLKIYNLSFAQLVNNSGPIFIKLLNELAIFFSIDNKDKSINKLGAILTKDQNLLYIGILILILSFFLWLISVTS